MFWPMFWAVLVAMLVAILIFSFLIWLILNWQFWFPSLTAEWIVDGQQIMFLIFVSVFVELMIILGFLLIGMVVFGFLSSGVESLWGSCWFGESFCWPSGKFPAFLTLLSGEIGLKIVTVDAGKMVFIK